MRDVVTVDVPRGAAPDASAGGRACRGGRRCGGVPPPGGPGRGRFRVAGRRGARRRCGGAGLPRDDCGPIGTPGSVTWRCTIWALPPGRSPTRSSRPTPNPRSRHRWRRSAASTPACAPTAAWWAEVPPPTWCRCTSATATRCSTSGRSRTTGPRTPLPTCSSRARWTVTRIRSTAGSSGCGPPPGAPTLSRPTATSSCTDGAWAESRPQPRDREQRRALLARLDGRPDRRRPTLLPGEPRRAARRGRAAHPHRLLRRGHRAAARPGAGRRPAASGGGEAGSPPRHGHGHQYRRPSRGPTGSGDVVKHRLLATGDLAPGEARRVDVDGHRIAVVRIDDEFYAVGDTCSHAEVSLSEGEVLCAEREIECWKHGSTFSLSTGEPMCLPAVRPVPVYPVVVVGDDVEVEL